MKLDLLQETNKQKEKKATLVETLRSRILWLSIDWWIFCRQRRAASGCRGILVLQVSVQSKRMGDALVQYLSCTVESSLSS